MDRQWVIEPPHHSRPELQAPRGFIRPDLFYGEFDFFTHLQGGPFPFADFPPHPELSEKNATGTRDSMGNISRKTINTIPIPALALEKQKQLVEHLASFDEEILVIEKSGKTLLNDINLLPRKILAQVFGEARP